MRMTIGSLTKKMTAGMLCAIAGLSPLAVADVPGAVDRVPADAAFFVAMRDMEATTGRFTTLIESMGLPSPKEGDNPIAVSKKMLGIPGLNKNGSVAIAVVPGADGKVVMGNKEEGNEDKTTGVIIAPVSDYSAFVKAMGAAKTDAAGGVITIKIDEKDGFAKDLGGGYAALTTIPGLLDKFDGKAGSGAMHAKHMGKNGNAVSDHSDVVIVANIPQLQDQLKHASKQMKQQVEQMMAMAGGQAEGMGGGLKTAQAAFESFTKDAEVGVIGFKFADKGVSIDLGAQFKEGSESGKTFAAEGNAGSLVGKLPNLPFFFAGAFDFSSPVVKKIVKDLAAQAGDAAKEGDKAKTDNASRIAMMAKSIDTTNGASFSLGSLSPAGIMGGGLFVNTVVYTQTTDAKGYIAAAADALKKADGQKNGPITTKSSYTEGAMEIGGTKIDTWTMMSEVDENDPMAQYAGMAMKFLMGPVGLSGMTAPVDGGVVTVYSQNAPLMTAALDAAKSGKSSLSGDALLKEVQSNLPANRTVEFYVGIRQLIEIGSGVMMMQGRPEIKVPAQMSPIGLGATTADSGVHLRLFLATDVLKGLADVVKQVKAGDNDEEVDNADEKKKDDGGKPPRF